MLASAIYKDSSLRKHYGYSFLYEVRASLISLNILKGHQHLDRNQLAIYLFCVFASGSSLNGPQTAANLNRLINRKNVKFLKKWKSLIFDRDQMGFLINDLKYIYFAENAEFVNVILNDGESEFFGLPSRVESDVLKVSIITGKFLASLCMGLQSDFAKMPTEN